MINLKDTTFIIPLAIESQDRLNNSKTVLGFLNHHFNTNVIIHELTNGDSKLLFLDTFKNLNIKHIIEVSDLSIYHRTRQLNEMLDIVKTKVVVNYDIDVILPINTYIKSSELIINNDFDIIYPYGDGMYQKRVFNTFDRKKFNTIFDLNYINENNCDMWNAKYGHCVFFNTEIYKKYGGENENFIAYGPEDSERYERFLKIGCKISRIDDIIYHFEHYRTPFSNELNSFFEKNNILYNLLKSLDKQDTIDYYNKVDYKKKYFN